MGDLNTADLLVQCLENEDVEYIFGVPGKKIFISSRRLSNPQFALLPLAMNRALHLWRMFMGD
jgi:hypothetical protein